MGARLGIASSGDIQESIAEADGTTPTVVDTSRSRSEVATEDPAKDAATVVVDVSTSTGLKRTYSVATSKDELDQENDDYSLET